MLVSYCKWLQTGTGMNETNLNSIATTKSKGIWIWVQIFRCVPSSSVHLKKSWTVTRRFLFGWPVLFKKFKIQFKYRYHRANFPGHSHCFLKWHSHSILSNASTSNCLQTCVITARMSVQVGQYSLPGGDNITQRGTGKDGKEGSCGSSNFGNWKLWNERAAKLGQRAFLELELWLDAASDGPHSEGEDFSSSRTGRVNRGAIFNQSYQLPTSKYWKTGAHALD